MFIKKLIKRKEKIEPDHVFCLHDIYFVINFETETIIPIIFNTDYTAVQRLDTMEIIYSKEKEKKEKGKKESSFIYTPNFLIEVKDKYPSSETIFHNNKYYTINPIAIRMLFNKDFNSMQFLNDIQVLNAERLDLKYNLVRKYKFMREHVSSHNIAYINDKELLSMISFITTSKSFKYEVKSYNNKIKSELSKKF